MYNYFPFIITGDFSGEYTEYSSTSFNNPNGNISQPSDILKFNSGSNAWSQSPMLLYYPNIDLTITSLSDTDWTTNQKYKWLDDYLKYTNMYNYITSTYRTLLFDYLESINIFEELSAPSLAYITKNDGTNGLVLDPLLMTNEVSIGLNTYSSPFILDYINSLPNNNSFKNLVYLHHIKGDVLISNACKINYNGYVDIVYCFGGIEYPLYDISNIGLIPSLTNGGGNIFSEVKLAGNDIQAHYIVKKNVDDNDPTFGLCSGEGKPFCMGDIIVIIDTTCFTTNSSSGWTWVGDNTQFNLVWDIADITDTSVYANTPIAELLFPLRTISFDEFDKFN